jgi:hypothetical protein
VQDGAVGEVPTPTVSAPGRVTAFSPTGDQLWTTAIPKGTFFAHASVSSRHVFVPIEGATGRL